MYAIKGAKLLKPDGNWLKGHALLVDDGNITDIHSGEIPTGVDIIDAKDKWITPGLIDVHTHLGVHEEAIGVPGADFNETSEPATPYVRALDGINPQELGFKEALKSGVTSAQIMPGSANAIGGEMVTLKTAGEIVDQMVIKAPSGLKGATGENPKRIHGEKGKAPVTRMGIASIIRKTYYDAKEYMKNSNHFDLGMESVAKVLKGEVPFRVHAHRADDIVTALRIKKEFNIPMTIEHCTEGHKIADYIADHDVSVSFGPTMTPRVKVELADKGWETAQILSRSGINFAITTDHPVIGIDHLMTSAITAVKYGLAESEALKSITTNAAKHLQIQDQTGDLSQGKSADLVIWNGHPLDHRSSVETTLINGDVVYEHEAINAKVDSPVL